MAIRPYEDWLGIPGSVERPSHYELLGLTPGVVEESLLKAHYEHRYAQVRCYEVGNYCDEATRLLREITVAYDVLRDPVQKQSYDTELERAAERTTQHDSPMTHETVSESTKPAGRDAPGMGDSRSAARAEQPRSTGPVRSQQATGPRSPVSDKPTVSVAAKAGSGGHPSAAHPAAKPRAADSAIGAAVMVQRTAAASGAVSVGSTTGRASATAVGSPDRTSVASPSGKVDQQPVLVTVNSANETTSAETGKRNQQTAILAGGGVALVVLLGVFAWAIVSFTGGGEPHDKPEPTPSPTVAEVVPTPATESASDSAVALDQLSGELRKVVVVPSDSGDAIHLLIMPIQGDPVEAFVADESFAEQLWDIPSTVELEQGKSGPIVQVSGRLVEQQELTARFEEARRWMTIQRIQSPQGSAEVGKPRSTYSLPEIHRNDLHRLRKVDEHVELTAYLESEPQLGRTPPFETVVVVQNRRYLVEIPAAWRDAISGQDVAEPLVMTAEITGRFANREGRELPLLRGLSLADSASSSTSVPPAETVAASSTPSPKEVPPPTPTPVMPRTEPPPRTTPDDSASPAERLDAAVELPPRDSFTIHTLGELSWSASPEVKLMLDSRCADLPSSTQIVLDPTGPQRYRALLMPANQVLADLAIQDNRLKFAWLKDAPPEAIQLRNCRVKISDGTDSAVLQLREPIFSKSFSPPGRQNETQVPLQVRDVPDRSKLVWEASVEFDGTPVDKRAIGQQLKSGAKRRYVFKDVSQLGELAEAIGVELRLGYSEGELILNVSPSYRRSPHDHELTEEGLREGLEAVVRSFAGAQQKLVEAQQRFVEVRDRKGANPKVRATNLESAERAIAGAQETMAKAVFYKENVHPSLVNLAIRVQNSVKIRFRVTANVDDAVILLHDCEYRDAAVGNRN